MVACLLLLFVVFRCSLFVVRRLSFVVRCLSLVGYCLCVVDVLFGVDCSLSGFSLIRGCCIVCC